MKLFWAMFGVLLVMNCVTSCNRTRQEDVNKTTSSSTSMAEAMHKIADGKFVKVGGWQIPQTDLMRRRGSGRGHLYAESGDLVDTEFESFYAPLVKIYSFDNEKQAGLTAGLEVETIVKVSVGGNVFAIEITGILVRSKDGSVEPVQIGPATFERFLDSDGDGVFETYIVDSSQMKVPAWAYTNK